MTHENFKDYKSGQSICVQVSLQCERKQKGTGHDVKIDVTVLPHETDPAKLAEMFTKIEDILSVNGFCIELFGTPQNMLNRLSKRIDANDKTLTINPNTNK